MSMLPLVWRAKITLNAFYTNMCPLISMGSPKLHGFDTLIKFIIIIIIIIIIIFKTCSRWGALLVIVLQSSKPFGKTCHREQSL